MLGSSRNVVYLKNPGLQFGGVFPNGQNVFYEIAEAECAAQGMRLCDVTELNQACGTGCGHDERAVWTSTPCKPVYERRSSTPVEASSWLVFLDWGGFNEYSVCNNDRLPCTMPSSGHDEAVDSSVVGGTLVTPWCFHDDLPDEKLCPGALYSGMDCRLGIGHESGTSTCGALEREECVKGGVKMPIHCNH